MGRRRRRWPRILLHAAAAVSLVLCVGAAVLWCRDLGYCLLVFRGTGWTVGSFEGPSIGLDLDIETLGPTYHWRLPYWAAVLLGLVLPLWRTRIHFRPRRSRHACHKCGYDLRATPDRCPECGQVQTTGSPS
jgi:hypothetical protein